MKLSDLVIERFLGHQHSELPLDRKITFVVGPNGAGKTSVVDAVEVLLTGKARGFDKNEAHLMARGEKGFKVSGDVEMPDGLPQSLGTDENPKSVRVTRTTSQVTPKQSDLDEVIGDRRCLAASLHVSRFLEMTPDERKYLVWDLCRPDTTEVVKKVALIGMPDNGREKALLDLVGGGDFKHSLAFVTEWRRDVQRAAATALPTVNDAEEATARGPLKRSRLPESAVLRAGLEKARGDLEAARAAAKTPASALAARLEIDLERTKEALARANVEVDRAGKDWDKAEPRAKELDALISAGNADLETLKSSYARWKAVVALLDTKDEIANCPCCTHKMDDDERNALASRLDEARHGADADEKSGKALASNIGLWQRERSKCEDPFTTWETKGQEIGVLGREIKRISEDLAKAKAADTGPAPTAASLGALEARVKTGERLLEARVVYETEAAKRAEAERNAAAATAEGERYARIEAVLKEPADADAMDEALKTVRARCAEGSPVLFYGDEAGVAVGDDWAPQILGRDVRAASKSERTRAAIVLAYALAALSHTGFLVLDDVEEMDKATRRSLVQFLLKVEGEFDTILVLAAEADRKTVKAPPAGSPISMWWCEAGKLEEVKS